MQTKKPFIYWIIACLCMCVCVSWIPEQNWIQNNKNQKNGRWILSGHGQTRLQQQQQQDQIQSQRKLNDNNHHHDENYSMETTTTGNNNNNNNNKKYLFEYEQRQSSNNNTTTITTNANKKTVSHFNEKKLEEYIQKNKFLFSSHQFVFYFYILEI